MADFKSKLDRLMGSRPGPPGIAVEPNPDVIAALRTQIEGLLAGTRRLTRSAETHQALSSPTFDRNTSDCWSSRVALPLSERVGSFPIHAAGDASMELIGLLGLDPSLGACSPRSALYLDTETTGLGHGAGTLAFLVGMAHCSREKGWILEQLLLSTPSQEPSMLEHIRHRMSQAQFLVTFNGKSFDWPLLVGRFVMNRIPVPEALPHLDLLHLARRIHRSRLGAVGLQRLESEVLGLARVDDIAGAEIGPRYAHFLRTGQEEGLWPVLTHNRQDVLSMMSLVGLWGEPLDCLDERDLVEVGRTLRKAGGLDHAGRIARHLQAGRLAGEGHWLSAEIAKARGDRARALLGFELAAREIDDPKVRLELCKLYEHFARSPWLALATLAEGTGETGEQVERRRKRLQRKAERQLEGEMGVPRRRGGVCQARHPKGTVVGEAAHTKTVK